MAGSNRAMIPGLHRIPPRERYAALLSVVTSVTLLGIKIAAYLLTGSAAVFSDAMEGIVNVLASGVAMYALLVAHTPADDEHPYGHGKIEFLSAAFEGGMILLASIAMIIKAVDVLYHGAQLQARPLDQGIVLLICAMLVNAAVGGYLLRTGRQQGSMTLEADGRHLLSDALTSVAAVIAMLLVKLTGWGPADPLIAILMAIHIAAMGVRLVNGAAGKLMDRQDAEDDRLLRTLLDGHMGPAGRQPIICGYHKMRHRHSGRYHWVDFHLVVPASLNVDEGHRIASAIEYEIEQALRVGNATAHIEPCPHPDCESCHTPLELPPPPPSAITG